MRRLLQISILTIFITLPLAIRGQDSSCNIPTTDGTDFWVAWFLNAEKIQLHTINNATLSLFATGSQASSITVSNNQTGWSQTYSHPGGTAITYIQLPNHWDTISGQPSTMGYHVTSSAPVFIYASNYYRDSWDVCNILPTRALGTNYIIQDYENAACIFAPQMALVATEDSTHVSLTLTAAAHGVSTPVGNTFTITLQQGQSYMLHSRNYLGFSGSEITSDKPIALFQGHSCGLTASSGGNDLMLEQVRPIDTWGTEFIVTSTKDRTEGDLVRVTAGADNCQVQIGNSIHTTLSRGQTYEFNLGSSVGAAMVTTSQPAQVCLYPYSYHNNRTLGDPAQVLIHPVDRWVCRAIVPTYNCNSNTYDEQYIAPNHHYLNIVTQTSATSTMLLDGTNVTGFTDMGNGFSYARLTVSPGIAHTLENSNGTFYANAYGLGKWVCYNFEVGMRTSPTEPLPECQLGNAQGTDFWATFLCNDDNPTGMEISLVATGAQAATVTVSNPRTGWSQNYSLAAGSSVKALLPSASSMTSGQPCDIGYHVTSTSPITLYACNYTFGSWDFNLVLPTYAIGDNYIVQNYPNNSDKPANLGFVATEDNTILSMVLPCRVSGLNLMVGDTYTVTLDSGQSLLLRARNESDFSGMEVSSNCKPFALFQGCGAGRVGSTATNTGRDLFMEQAIPPAMWGTEFAVRGCNRSEGDRVLITAGADNCTVTINGTTLSTLQRGQTYEYTLAAGNGAHITTSQPAYSCLYMVSYHNGGSNGDPGAATIPPVDRWVCHSDFMLLQCNPDPTHTHYIANPYISIVAENSAIGTLALDGTVIPASQFHPITGTQYSHANMHISYGAHNLDASTTGTFAARAYGLGYWVGFTYNIDMRFDTAERCVTEMHHDTIDLFDTICQGKSYYQPIMNLSVNSDQTSSSGNLEFWTDSVMSDTMTYHYHLSLTIQPTITSTETLSVILGDTLFYADSAITTAGTYTFVFTASNGCDSVVTLIVSYEAIGLSANKDDICPGDEVTITASGTTTYFWGATPADPEIDAQQGMNPIVVHPQTTTVYSLLDASGIIVASITIGTENAPELCVEVNRQELDFDNPVLTYHDCSEGRHHTIWTFADSSQFVGERLRRQFRHPLPDSVTVTMTSCNQYNCCVDTTFTLPMRIRSVWFPNVFTPDADNNNLFQCYTSFDVEKFSMVIYNRWGFEIWSTEDVNEPWDGRRADGIPCVQGAYVYRYWIHATDNRFESGIGTITLLR